MAVERKYERDIDIMLAEEFEVSPEFAAWFLARTRNFSGVEARVVDVKVSVTDHTGESDLVIIFEEEGSQRRFALHIEDKIDAPLQPEQEQRYRRRARAAIDRGEYSDGEVILCSPESYPRNHADAVSFDTFVSYEAISGFLKSHRGDDPRMAYRANFIASAATSTSGSWTRVVDDLTNKFWNTAFEIANKEFPELEMKPLALTKDSTWITLRPQDMPTRPVHIYLSFKGDRGFMDLTFSGCAVSLFSQRVQSILEPGMTMHATGRSTAIRITVDAIKVSSPDDAALMRVRAAFAASVRLIRFYRQNRQLLDQAAIESCV